MLTRPAAWEIDVTDRLEQDSSPSNDCFSNDCFSNLVELRRRGPGLVSFW